MSLELQFLSRRVFGGGQQQVAFVVDGSRVYFTALTPHGSSINTAEEIILAICRTIGRNWQRLTFHDLQTWRGYTGKRQGWWVCDRLEIRKNGDRPSVEAWHPVARWPYPPVCDRQPSLPNPGDPFETDREELAEEYAPELAKLPGLPRWILNTFQPVIDGAEFNLDEPA